MRWPTTAPPAWQPAWTAFSPNPSSSTRCAANSGAGCPPWPDLPGKGVRKVTLPPYGGIARHELPVDWAFSLGSRAAMGLEEQPLAHHAAAAASRREGVPAHPAAKAVAAARQRSSEAVGGAPTVLVVEDNLVNQLVALEFLTLLGVRARLAVDGEEALALC